MKITLCRTFTRWLALGGAACLLLTLPACRTMAPSAPSVAVSPRSSPKEATGSRGDVASAGLRTDSPPSLPADEEIADAAPVVNSDGEEVRPVSYDPPTLPPQAFGGAAGPATGHFGDLVGDCPPGGYPHSLNACPPGMGEEGLDYGYWQPDGLHGPWPYDEYIFDGGDRDVPVKVDGNWTVRGIDQEDTIAHYDTLQGRREVTPSNRVPIYAPRFASVRKVYGLELHEGHERLAGVENPVRLNSQEANRIVTSAVQQTPPVLEHNFRSTVALRDQTRGIGVENLQLLQGFSDFFLPYEDFRVIRRGQFDATERARLSQRVAAAIVWTRDQSVQVVIEGAPAYEAKGTNRAAETTQYELPPGKPRLRIIKVASKSEAQPGEEIDFTLRFDNVGDQRISNVTIIDSLTTRLEYVDDSAQCDRKAKFGTQGNEAESLLLRWEIAEPLDVGQGGIIRFKCKVR